MNGVLLHPRFQADVSNVGQGFSGWEKLTDNLPQELERGLASRAEQAFRRGAEGHATTAMPTIRLDTAVPRRMTFPT